MSIIKNLRALSRQQGSLDDIAEFNRQIRLEGNDRGAALLAATNAEVALTQAIYQIIRPTDEMQEKLDRQGGPLASFGQRITMGRVLGIYGPDTEYNLDLVRQIRNAFAHAHVPITFETKEVSTAIGLFKTLPLLPPHTVGGDKIDPASGARERFQCHCEIVTHNLGVWGWFGIFRVDEVHLRPGHVAFSQPKRLP